MHNRQGEHSRQCGNVEHPNQGIPEDLVSVSLYFPFDKYGLYLPMALPVAHAINVAATTVDFFVAPAILRDTIDNVRVWADQKDIVM
jgi:hypothetical protein